MDTKDGHFVSEDSLNAMSKKINVQCLTYGEWIIFFKPSLFNEDEPCIAQNFMFNQKTGQFVCKVWNIVVLKGHVENVHELPSLLRSSLVDSSACLGSFDLVQKMQSECGLLTTGANSYCGLCNPICKTEPESESTHDGNQAESMYDDAIKEEHGEEKLDAFEPKVEISELNSIEVNYETVSHSKTFVCDSCPRKFVSEIVLKRHVERSHSSENHECNICDENYVNLKSYLNHVSANHPQIREIYCKFCEHIHEIGEYLNRYSKCLRLGNKKKSYKYHEDNNGLACIVCKDAYKNVGNYVKHVQQSHPHIKELYCQYCDAKHETVSFGQLYKDCMRRKIKRSKDTGDSNFMCNKCDEPFKSIKYYVKHMMKIHPYITELFCSICKEDHETEKFEESYKACTKIKREVPSVACDKCFKMFKDKDRLREHYNVHSQEKLYKCSDCDFETYNTHTYRGHLVKHKLERGELSFTCHQCGRNFTTNNYLQKHIRRFHEKIEDNIKCEHCGIVFRRLNTYRGHVNIHHSDNPEYACKHCGKRWETIPRRKAHERIHEGLTTIPTIPCPHCGKEVVKKNMAAHIRTHTGEKPYKCKDCDYACVSSTALSLHRRRHRTSNQTKK